MTNLEEVTKTGDQIDDRRYDITIPLKALYKEMTDESSPWRLKYYPLVVRNLAGQIFVKDSGGEDLMFAPFDDLHDNEQHASSINGGVARLNTRTMGLIDVEGDDLMPIGPHSIQAAQCYSADVPPSCMDASVIEQQPLCCCHGPSWCTAAQVCSTHSNGG